MTPIKSSAVMNKMTETHPANDSIVGFRASLRILQVFWKNTEAAHLLNSLHLNIRDNVRHRSLECLLSQRGLGGG